MDRVVLPPELAERLDLVLMRLGGALRSECLRAVSALRMNEEQYTMLQVVAAQGPMGRSQAYERAGLDPRVADTVLAGLVRRGAVGVVRCPRDRRRRQYEVTVEGLELLEAATIRANAARAAVLAELPDHERESFLTTMRRFVDLAGSHDLSTAAADQDGDS
jgi:DNA-binding MarR family transcriptional regulator